MRHWEHWAVRAEVYRSKADLSTDPAKRPLHLGMAANLDRVAELKRRGEEIARSLAL